MYVHFRVAVSAMRAAGKSKSKRRQASQASGALRAQRVNPRRMTSTDVLAHLNHAFHDMVETGRHVIPVIPVDA